MKNDDKAGKKNNELIGPVDRSLRPIRRLRSIPGDSALLVQGPVPRTIAGRNDVTAEITTESLMLLMMLMVILKGRDG